MRSRLGHWLIHNVDRYPIIYMIPVSWVLKLLPKHEGPYVCEYCGNEKSSAHFCDGMNP